MTKSSNNFGRQAVRAIGRKSLSQVTGMVLGKGVMWKTLHAVGKVPDDSEWLKMVVKLGTNVVWIVSHFTT